MNTLPEPLRNEKMLKLIFLILSAVLIIFFFVPLYGSGGDNVSFQRIIAEGSGMIPAMGGFVFMIILPVIMVVFSAVRLRKPDLFLFNIIPAVIYLIVLCAAPQMIVRSAVKQYAGFLGGYSMREAIREASSSITRKPGFAIALVITLLLIADWVLAVMAMRADGQSFSAAAGQLGESIGQLGARIFKGGNAGQSQYDPQHYQNRQDSQSRQNYQQGPSGPGHSQAGPARQAPGQNGAGPQADKTPPRLAFCPQCGSPLKDGARFCSKCGNAIRHPGQ